MNILSLLAWESLHALEAGLTRRMEQLSWHVHGRYTLSDLPDDSARSVKRGVIKCLRPPIGQVCFGAADAWRVIHRASMPRSRRMGYGGYSPLGPSRGATLTTSCR